MYVEFLLCVKYSARTWEIMMSKLVVAPTRFFTSYWGIIDSKPGAFTVGFTNAVVDVCTEGYGKKIGGTHNPDRYMVKERFLEPSGFSSEL